MRRGHGQLFRSKFEPIAQMGDVVCLRDGGGGLVADDSSTPFYEVTGVEGSPALNTHGVLVVWCATDVPGAPYLADKNSQVGQNLGVPMPSGQFASFSPAALQLYPRQIMQFRTLIVAVPDSNGAALDGAIDDFDVRWGMPGNNLRGGSDWIPGVMNAMMQSDLPSMIAPAPAQGSNFAGSVTSPQEDPFELANRTELIAYANGGRSINIFNNSGSAATTGAIGLVMAGYVMNLSPVDPTGSMPKQYLGNAGVLVPADVNLADVIALPIGIQTQPQATAGKA